MKSLFQTVLCIIFIGHVSHFDKIKKMKKIMTLIYIKRTS